MYQDAIYYKVLPINFYNLTILQFKKMALTTSTNVETIFMLRDEGRGGDGGRLSRSSDSDWLEDSEGMIRLRHFLAGPPPPDWEHSTSSDSDD